MDRSELENKLQEYRFFHTIDLGDGVSTPGPAIQPHQKLIMQLIASTVRGKSVLDLGCANGLFSFHAERHGASRILAVDNTARVLAPMNELLIPYFHSMVQTKQANILSLSPDEIGRFDVVICAGLLYHLRYPFWSLRIIRDLLVDNGILILETAIWADSNRHALLHCPLAKDSPYMRSPSFFNSRALSETLSALGLRVQSFQHTTPLHKAALQALGRWSFPSYVPIRRTVVVCLLDASSADPDLAFYEGTKELKMINSRTRGHSDTETE